MNRSMIASNSVLAQARSLFLSRPKARTSPYINETDKAEITNIILERAAMGKSDANVAIHILWGNHQLRGKLTGGYNTTFLDQDIWINFIETIVDELGFQLVLSRKSLTSSEAKNLRFETVLLTELAVTGWGD